LNLHKLFHLQEPADKAKEAVAASTPWDAWDNLPATVYVRGRDGRLLYANARFSRAIGRPAGQLIGMRNCDLFEGAGSERLTAMEEALLSGRIESFSQSFPLRLRDDESIELTVLVSGYPLDLPGGVAGMVGVALDVTPFAQAEVQLARERDFTHTVLDTAGTLIAVVDLDQKLLRWNRACEQLLGCHESEVRGRPISDLFSDNEDPGRLREAWSELLTGHSPQTGVNRLPWRDSRERWLSWSAAVVRNDDGEPEYVVLTAVDITQQVLAENQQSQLAREFRAVWESATDAMLFVDADGRIVAANPSFLALTRSTREESEGQPFVQVLREWPGHEDEEIEKFKDQFRRRAIEPSTTSEFTLKTGNRLWLECANSFLDRPGFGPLLLQVIRNITSRVHTEQELRSTNEFLKTTTQWAREMAAKAEMASAAKSEFLANVSHEIRTPMNGVLGMTELTLMTELTGEQHEYLDLVRSSAESLLALLDDLLDLSKVEAGRMELEPEPFHLRTVIADTMRPMHLRGSARGLEVSWTVDERLPAWIAGDKGRLRQVLLNLVGNSIKFTDSGGVRLEVASLGPASNGAWRIRFVVSDTGIGIAQEKLDDIFEPFTQLPRKSKMSAGGTGLGLSISNKLVELMGGRLFAASSTGAGSAFSFAINLPAAAHSDPQALHSTVPGAIGKPRTQICVLVAEDHPVNQKLIQGMLKKAGYDCLIVPDGRAAVDSAREGRFDLALMDVQMPELDGLEATRHIRAEELDSGRRMPIIAMTAHAMPGDRESCIEAGMDGYLSKPIRLDTLLMEIERVLQLQAADPDKNQLMEPGGEQEKMTPLVDSEAALARVGGDAQLLAELADLFLVEYPRLLEKAKLGLESGDFALVGSNAHQLKGLLAQFGCEAGRAASLRLESASKLGQLEEAGNAAAELERLLSAARPELETLAQAGHSGH